VTKCESCQKYIITTTTVKKNT